MQQCHYPPDNYVRSYYNLRVEQWCFYTLADLPEYCSCSQHGVVAARLTSGGLGSIIILSGSLGLRSVIIPSVTAGVFEIDRQNVLVRAQCFAPYRYSSSSRVQS
jgi:hypothetical protein